MKYHELVPAILETVSTNSAAFRNWFAGSKVVDAAGNPIPVYHGTMRPDRVGTRFRKARATAGPMAYFTDDPEIASNYASSKTDTSLQNEDTDWADWYKVKLPGMRSLIPINRAWYSLSSEERTRMTKLAPRVAHDEDEEIALLGPEITRGIGNYDYALEQKHGNVIEALIDGWLYGGTLCGDEEAFLTVLRLAGLTRPIIYDPPNASYPFVYQVFLCIRNPLITTAIPTAVMEALHRGSNRQPHKSEFYGYQWAKDNVDARQWFRDLLNDVERTHSWTVIPEWVTRILKSLGYDGIKDVGGKNSGRTHTVWIPFEENQVKSAISNNKFDSMKKGIHA